MELFWDKNIPERQMTDFGPYHTRTAICHLCMDEEQFAVICIKCQLCVAGTQALPFVVQKNLDIYLGYL